MADPDDFNRERIFDDDIEPDWFAARLLDSDSAENDQTIEDEFNKNESQFYQDLVEFGDQASQPQSQPQDSDDSTKPPRETPAPQQAIGLNPPKITPPAPSPGLTSLATAQTAGTNPPGPAIDSPSDLSPSEGGFFRSDSLGPSDVGESNPESIESQYQYREVIVDDNGLPRQAGADSQEGEFIKRFRTRAEQSLFVFAKGVLNLTFLTPHFHQDVCEFFQKVPPFRKLGLLPRGHVKTGIVSNSLPTHIIIQPAEGNLYLPGIAGTECRILLAGENATMAEKNLRVITSNFEDNRVLRAFWPGACWPAGKRPKTWSQKQIILPRANEWPDPTIKAVGVGGAITGARPNVLIEDDLVSFKAMNSPVVMQEAIDWHITARALLDKYTVESNMQSLQYVIGTRWAVFDLYSYIIDNDPSVEVIDERYHRIIRDGKILWPEKYTEADVEQLRLEYGSLFYLLYLNSAADPSLTDFDIELVRKFSIQGGKFVFEGDARDIWLEKRMERVFGKTIGEVSAATDALPGRGERFDLGRVAEALRGSGVRLIGGR